VFEPPWLSGMMWSNSSLSWDPQSTHCPPSRRYIHSWEEPSEEEQQLTEALVFVALIDPEQLSELDKQQLRRLSKKLRRYSEHDTLS
jgi:hypothetical protein